MDNKVQKPWLKNYPKGVASSINFDEYVWDNLLSTLRKSSWIKERVKKELLGEKYGISSVRRSVNKYSKRSKYDTE